MGTKNNPGKFDCYANADPDEPMFVLLGRDPTASMVVTFWVAIRKVMEKQKGLNIQDPKTEEARQCARAMEDWARNLGKGELIEAALVALQKLTVQNSVRQ